MSETLRIETLDIKTLPDEAHPEYLAFNNRLREESHPDDPPRTLEGQIARWRNIPPFLTLFNWVARDTSLPGNPIIGTADLNLAHQEANQHIAMFGVAVRPERRQEGIARKLLAHVVATAQEQKRTLLMGGSHDRISAGEAFFQALGAEPGLKSSTNQLVLAELDDAFLQTYREESERRGASGFEFVRLDSPLSEEWLIPIAELTNRISDDVPLGDLNAEPEHLTPEELRASEETHLAAGVKVYSLLALAPDGKLAGLTQMYWSKHADYVAQQGITGVLPEYRGQGLARYLKARMLEIIRAERPEVRYVRTDNATSNAGMLAINHALGFRLYRSETYWQVPTEKVMTYLAKDRK